MRLTQKPTTQRCDRSRPRLRRWYIVVIVALAASLLAGLTLSACTRTAWRPRLVVLVVLEACRADHLGCYGYKRPTSPNIDAIATDGVVFERTFAQSNTTLFSSMSLMTGRYPERFGELEPKSYRLPPGTPTIASTLGANGYRTGGFVGGLHWSGSFGLQDGFATYSDRVQGGTFHDQLPLAMDWLNQQPKTPTFMLLQGYDLHAPYEKPLFFSKMFDPSYQGVAELIGKLPDGILNIHDGHYFIERPSLTDASASSLVNNLPFAMSEYYDKLEKKKREGAAHIDLSAADVNHLVSLYDSSIRYADLYLGLLMARIHKLGLERDTLMIIVGDLGEGLMENGFFDHQGNLLDAELHVPMIVWGPGGIPQGRRVSQVTQLVDVVPTLSDYTLAPGAAAGAAYDGKSLRPLIEGGAANDDAAAFSEGVRPMITVRTQSNRLLCRRHLPTELPPLGGEDYRYFEVVDGKERNVAPDEHARRLWERLRAWAQEVAPPKK